MRILLVENDPFDALEMSHMLRLAAAAVDIADTGATACVLAGLHVYDLVLLDLALPDMEGCELLRRLRAARVEVPVMMLPGDSRPAEKLQTLGLGAGGSGPFDPSAFAAGIQAATRVLAGSPRPALTAGALVLNPTDRTVTAKGRPLHLTGKEYEVLELLMQHKGAVLTKAAFLDHLYGGPAAPEVKIIDVFICKLRRKLGRVGAGDMIGTVWGQGYVLREPAARRPVGDQPALAA